MTMSVTGVGGGARRRTARRRSVRGRRRPGGHSTSLPTPDVGIRPPCRRRRVELRNRDAGGRRRGRRDEQPTSDVASAAAEDEVHVRQRQQRQRRRLCLRRFQVDQRPCRRRDDDDAVDVREARGTAARTLCQSIQRRPAEIHSSPRCHRRPRSVSQSHYHSS